jgi:hypothetical protein
MIALVVWRFTIGAAVLLTALPLFNRSTWNAAIGHAALWNLSPTPQFMGVFILLVISSFAGISRKGNALAVLFFVSALIGAIADARFAFVFAAVAAPMLLERRVA